MAVRTQQQLATAVLQRLRVVAADETPSAADKDLITTRYAEKVEDWSDENVVYWSGDEIPLAVFPTLVSLMANEVQNEFGRAVSLADMMAIETLLLKRLRRHVAVGRSGEPIKAVFY